MTSPARILVVAHRRAATPKTARAVATRAQHGPWTFVLVPRPYWDPETEEAANVIELAVPLLEQAPGGMFEAAVGNTDPLVAVRQALERSQFDEVIVLTLPRRLALAEARSAARVERLGVRMTVAEAIQSSRTWEP